MVATNRSIVISLISLLAANPDCLADSTAWVRAIESGRQVKVVFDKTAGKFDDSTYTSDSNTDPMGTLQGGETYTLKYSNGNFDCTGYNQGTGKVGTWGYPDTPAKPADNRMSLWGRIYAFDGLGNVYDEKYGLVGSMALVPSPEQSSFKIKAKSFYPTTTANPSWVITEVAVDSPAGAAKINSVSASSCWDGTTRGSNNGVCVKGVDGSPVNVFNGKRGNTITTARDFWSPFYKNKDLGEWIQIGFQAPLTIRSITLYQVRAGTLTSSLVSPVKYTAYVKDVELTFSDGSTKALVFPNADVATVTLE